MSKFGRSKVQILLNNQRTALELPKTKYLAITSHKGIPKFFISVRGSNFGSINTFCKYMVNYSLGYKVSHLYELSKPWGTAGWKGEGGQVNQKKIIC